jgi:hypothetical protein
MADELTYEQVLEMFKETNKQFQDNSLKMKETERLLKEMFQETDKKFQATDRQFKETDKKFQDTDRQFKETDKKIQATDEMINKLGKNVGGLNKSIGNLSEGLTFPSITKELYDKFKADYVTTNLEKHKKDDTIEIDIFAYSNSLRNEAFIVEVKSTLNNDALIQLKNNLKKFRGFFPEHSDKKLYGIISAIKATQKMIDKVNNHGFYFASVIDGFFKIEIPKGFKPKVF